MTEILLDQIETHLQQALTYNENAEVAPVALLWPDGDEQFVETVDALRDRLPLLTLGDLDEDMRRGPSYWLRCAVAGTVEVDRPEGVPVVYLPGVRREDLRAIEDCPRELAPIAELQYRGQWFAHPNGRDWTVRGLLSNRERGLGLQLAGDAATGDALLNAFEQLLALPSRRLAAQYIDAEFLHRLLNPDPVARLLEWLDDPTGFQQRLGTREWKAFVGLGQSEFDFDPGAEGEITGGRLLGERRGRWSEVWSRFEQSPERYSGIEARLRKGKPTDQLFAGQPGAWPQDNEEAETRLRLALQDLAEVPASDAREAIDKLWNEHRDRRNWVWAKLDQAPLAFALEQLHRLGQATSSAVTGDVDVLANAYADDGWKADDALIAALQAATGASDREAVVAAANAIYRPWVDASARALQRAIGPLANSGTYSPGPSASTDPGTVTVFVDGLRLDLAHRLGERLGGLDVLIEIALAALPTVTETAKPVLTPVPAGSLAPGKDLGPVRASSGAKATINVLRGFMAEAGVHVLRGAETGDPSGTAWTETADIDKRGHDFGVTFVDELDRELDDIAKRVKTLLDAGWEQVDVVTDHGWLLLPGGTERVDLPAATVEVKKGRCARLKDGADVSVPTVPWHWDSNVRIALAPGTSCFQESKGYEHGGVSLQECVVPRLSVRPGAVQTTTGGAAITKVKWLGLMCRVEYENIAPGAKVDIRGRPADPSTSVAETVKETIGSGRQSLHIPDEELEGEPAYVVVVADDGSILAQRDVVIGANR
ncbi:MAG: BREX-1 system phosphatase PglZ type B [Actinobacteria bacterium]|nr:BREX-1 system phosphatase PglZ type B [Actinomycetota bacterium]